MAKDKITFELKNDMKELDTLCRNMERFGASHGFSLKAAFEINLVLEEIFTNIIHYGFADKADHVVHISVSYNKRILTIRIQDDGIPFNPLETEPPDLDCDLEQRDIGGLGIHLIKGYTDGIAYQRVDDLNILTIKKKLTIDSKT